MIATLFAATAAINRELSLVVLRLVPSMPDPLSTLKLVGVR